jgi:hypothetical protein
VAGLFAIPKHHRNQPADKLRTEAIELADTSSLAPSGDLNHEILLFTPVKFRAESDHGGKLFTNLCTRRNFGL